MNITGSRNECIITANVPFYQSGNTENSSSTSVITITDENGLNLINCFGVNTRIDTITSTNIVTNTTTSGGTTVQSGGTTTTPVGFDTSSLTGACQNVIIIDPVETGTTETECLYTGVTFLDTGVIETDGLILVTYDDGSTSLNVHPDCCVSMDSNYIPEIGTEHYYVCRYRDFYDVTDCNNFNISGTLSLDENEYVIFDKTSGDTTTIVPSIECCTRYDLQELVLVDGIRCKEKVVPVCGEYRIESDVPDIGYAEFTVVATNLITSVVPTEECCTINGLSSIEVSGGFSCYKAINPPTASITLVSDCCNVNTGGGDTGVVTPNYVLSRPTSTAPSCDGFIATSFPTPVLNYDLMKVGTAVENFDKSTFIGNGQWYYFLSAESTQTTTKQGVIINSSGIITAIDGCYAPE